MQTKCIALLLVALFPCAASAAPLTYTESGSGDLSNDVQAPTALGAFDVGTNTVSGTMGGSPLDADVFTFEIPAGFNLNSIELAAFSVTSGTVSNGSFMTANTGNAFVNASTAGDLGQAITQSLGPLFASSLPVGPGDYSFWIQETAGGVVDYRINFGVTMIPEPTSFILLGLAMCGFDRRLLRRH